MTDLPLTKLVHGSNTYEIKDTAARNSLTNKQDTLVSGTNIKTINNESLLGSGNITISGSVPNQNIAVGATNPLEFWEGTSAEYNSGGGNITYYNWQSGGGVITQNHTLPATTAWKSIAYGDSSFVVTSWNTNNAAYSTDGGVTWNSSTLNGNGSIGVAYGNNTFVSLEVYANAANYSTDGGQTWSTMDSSIRSGYFSDINFGNNLFLAVASDTYLRYSSDGKTWNDSTLPSSDWYGVCYGNGKYVVTGVGKIAYSSDLTNWTEITFENSPSLIKCRYLNNKFIAMGAGNGYSNTNKYLYSTDGVTWTEGTFPVSSIWTDCIYANNQFIVVNMNNNIDILYMLTSDDGISWTSYVILSEYYDDTLSQSIAYGNNKFIIVDYSEQHNNKDYVKEVNFNSALSVYTADQNPTTESTVYSAPSTPSALTITSVGTGTITCSDSNTYDYNASGNQTVSQTVGEAHPNWICMIEDVGIKKGATTIASVTTVDQTYNASSTNAQSGVAVASGISDTLGTINTSLESIIAQGD